MYNRHYKISFFGLDLKSNMKFSSNLNKPTILYFSYNESNLIIFVSIKALLYSLYKIGF